MKDLNNLFQSLFMNNLVIAKCLNLETNDITKFTYYVPNRDFIYLIRVKYQDREELISSNDIDYIYINSCFFVINYKKTKILHYLDINCLEYSLYLDIENSKRFYTRQFF